jgi:hypothetical protein
MKHMVNRLFSKTRIPASSGIHIAIGAVCNDCMGFAEGIRIAEVVHRTGCSSGPTMMQANSDKS